MPVAKGEPMRRTSTPALAGVLLLSCVSSNRVHPRAAEEIRRGYDYLEQGDSERAEVAFEHALEFNPDLAEAMNGRGIVERRRNRLEEARNWYERTVRVSPDFAEGHSNLGEVLLARSDHQGAEQELTAALRIDPDMADARLNLARALVLRGRAEPDERVLLWARARREYLHLLEAEPLRAAAHHDLGYLLYESEDYAAAEQSYRRAVELSSRSVEAIHGLCISLARLGRCREGASWCQRCLVVKPGEPRCEQSLRAAETCGQ